MLQIKTIKELRNKNEISEMCYTSVELISERIDTAIEESEIEISNGGQLHCAKDVLKKLKDKHFGC